MILRKIIINKIMFFYYFTFNFVADNFNQSLAFSFTFCLQITSKAATTAYSFTQ